MAKLVLIPAVVMWVFWLLGQDKGIPVILILLAVVVLVYNYFTSNTVPGRYLYAMGGNEKAARLSGVNTKRIQFFAYTNMGFLASVAALVCVSRFNSAAPVPAPTMKWTPLPPATLVAPPPFGGVGKVGGAVIGAIFMGVLNNGMSILGIDQNWQRTVKGLVLLAAVIFDVMSKNPQAVGLGEGGSGKYPESSKCYGNRGKGCQYRQPFPVWGTVASVFRHCGVLQAIF